MNSGVDRTTSSGSGRMQRGAEAPARSRSLKSTGALWSRGRLRSGGNWRHSLVPDFWSRCRVMITAGLCQVASGGNAELQHLCIKLGVATGRDLAQACRDHYATPTVWFLWILCEIAISACDLAEVVGSAIGLQLLFGIPLVWGCIITALDVLAVLYLQTKGFRYIEAIVITLIVMIGSCFAAELIFSRPSIVGVALGFLPGPGIVTNQEMLYVSIGILGGSVMPHNLYLHSSIVQTRKFEQTPVGK